MEKESETLITNFIGQNYFESQAYMLGLPRIYTLLLNLKLITHKILS